jgi:hypothetical protein
MTTVSGNASTEDDPGSEAVAGARRVPDLDWERLVLPRRLAAAPVPGAASAAGDDHQPLASLGVGRQELRWSFDRHLPRGLLLGDDHDLRVLGDVGLGCRVDGDVRDAQLATPAGGRSRLRSEERIQADDATGGDVVPVRRPPGPIGVEPPVGAEHRACIAVGEHDLLHRVGAALGRDRAAVDAGVGEQRECPDGRCVCADVVARQLGGDTESGQDVCRAGRLPTDRNPDGLDLGIPARGGEIVGQLDQRARRDDTEGVETGT